MAAKRFTATVICGAALGVLLAASGATLGLGSGTAGAQNGIETVVTSHPRPGGEYVLVVTAAPGQENAVSDTLDSFIRIRDTVGITDDAAECTKRTPTRVRCQLQGLRRVNLNTGDMPDVLALHGSDACKDSGLRFRASTGSGSDNVTTSCSTTVRSGRGGDTLQGRRFKQRLFGGRGGDNITGGRGNNDYCDGQRGNDSGGAGCEAKISL